MWSAVAVATTLTNTVDILTAKQIIAGEKIIPIKFETVKYFSKSIFFTFSSHQKAFIKMMAGDKTIAIQITPILIKNTTNIAINGIHTASVCANDSIPLSNEA
ncbi:hypothetical protein J6T66_03500 [bacterium]|nr:hypothetical protein [bacterium]